jgi:hypothetical protein
MVVLTLPHARHCLSRVLLRPKRSRALFSTYYDSQSGLHVPIHNDQEISVVLNKMHDNTFVPPQLYKDDPGSDMPDKLQALQKAGIHGLILPPPEFPRDHRNLKTLTHISPKGFQLFSFSAPPTDSGSNTSVIFDFDTDSAMVEKLQESIQSQVENGFQTTLRLGDACFDESQEPILIANNIASLIDATKGGDFLWLAVTKSNSSNDLDADSVLRLCEELMYLDLAGATVKSRLVVDVMDEEVVGETMLLGVNKFVIHDEAQMEVVLQVAQEQGKTILQRD